MIDWDPIGPHGDLDVELLVLLVAALLVVVCCFVGAWTIGGWVWSLA